MFSVTSAGAIATRIEHTSLPRLTISRCSFGPITQEFVLLEYGFLAVDDHRQFTGEHEINFLGRRSVRPGAAAGQEMREADDQLWVPPASAPNNRNGVQLR